jgi:hypothetical protein
VWGWRSCVGIKRFVLGSANGSRCCSTTVDVLVIASRGPKVWTYDIKTAPPGAPRLANCRLGKNGRVGRWHIGNAKQTESWECGGHCAIGERSCQLVGSDAKATSVKTPKTNFPRYLRNLHSSTLLLVCSQRTVWKRNSSNKSAAGWACGRENGAL